jgi:hypothetical protein
MAIPLLYLPNLRYRAENFIQGQTTWVNTGTDGSTANLTINGNMTKVLYNSKIDGINKSFNVVQGGIDVSFNITTENINNYTLFTVARYNGINKNRIFSTSSYRTPTYTPTYNSFIGFHSNKNGVFYNYYWAAGASPDGIITSGTTHTTLTDWALTTIYPYNCRCNGVCRTVNLLYGLNLLPAFGVNLYIEDLIFKLRIFLFIKDNYYFMK